jgi:peptidyl-prolyl cis-trans isomerase SurA
MNRTGWWCGVLVFLAVLWGWVVSGACAETCNRVVAVVNNDVITQLELEKKIKEMTGFSVEDLKRKDGASFGETERRILEFLIDEKIAEAKIKELNITVSTSQVDATIKKLKEDNHWTDQEFNAQLQREGLTLEEYHEKIRKELERMQLIEFEVRSKIIIRDEDIKAYYEENKQLFRSTEKVHLAGIFLIRKRPDDPGEMDEIQKKGAEILERIKGGEDFGQLAKKFSEGPGAVDGGDLGTFDADQLEPQFKKIIDTLPEGSVSGLISSPNGIQILKVIQKQVGRTKPLEEVKEAIYSELYRQEVNRRYDSWIKGLRESSYTRILLSESR